MSIDISGEFLYYEAVTDVSQKRLSTSRTGDRRKTKLELKKDLSHAIMHRDAINEAISNMQLLLEASDIVQTSGQNELFGY